MGYATPPPPAAKYARLGVLSANEIRALAWSGLTEAPIGKPARASRCDYCRRPVAARATSCPGCGAPTAVASSDMEEIDV